MGSARQGLRGSTGGGAAELESAQAERDALRADRDRLKREVELIQGSRSWNLTRPLRTVRRRYDVLRRTPSN